MYRFVFNNCNLVSINRRTLGKLEIADQFIYFTPLPDYLQEDIETRDEMKSWSWVTEPILSCAFIIKDITDVRFRRYQQQPISLEISFVDCKKVIISFDSNKDCKEFHRVIRYQSKPPHLKPFLGISPRQVILRTKASYSKKLVTKAWVNREITTFDYLLALNSIAGRSFADLTQ